MFKHAYYSTPAVTLLVLLVMSGTSLAGQPAMSAVTFSQNRLNTIETNLTLALQSEMPSLQASAALVLREVKALAPGYGFSDAIIPLMGIVKDEHQDASTRIAAALALNDLHSGMGDFAIERTARFTDDKQLKHICQWLAYDRSREK